VVIGLFAGLFDVDFTLGDGDLDDMVGVIGEVEAGGKVLGFEELVPYCPYRSI
jgi:hypothetical protein